MMNSKTNFQNFLETQINPQQKKAITKKDGAIVVIAGAGSGKTRVITSRITNLLLNQSVKTSEIVALTFTNKAANEMKERLKSFIAPEMPLPFVGTFHSYCLFLLRTKPHISPYPNFSIIDDDDQKSFLKKIIKSHNLEKQISSTQLSYQISKYKNNLHNNIQDYPQLFEELLNEYEKEKEKSRCFDFDDLILTILKIFQKNKEFKEQFQKQIRHLLVDEYQDTNSVQHELIKQMALQKNSFSIDSLCIVGDEDQSIYSWRGAIATNMFSFQQEFKPVTKIKIEQNYRSVQPILSAANKVIEHNTKRNPKKLWSERKAKGRILSLNCQSCLQESDTISFYLKSLNNPFAPLSQKQKNKKLKDVAVLYRTHSQSRKIEESLIRNSIPYEIIGGIRFYERREIKDLLAYLKLIVNPFDRASFFRIINRPARGLGTKFEETLKSKWNQNLFLDFHQIIELLISEKDKSITKKKAESLKQFSSIFKSINKDQNPKEILETIIEKTEYISFLKRSHDPYEFDNKQENVKEFINSIDRQKINLEDFLYEVALIQEKMDEANKKDSDKVQMMTLHAAKGLEFDTVIIAGLEEGILPSIKSMSEHDDVEEERRLFYVGMTRAKERLILMNAQYRYTYGQTNQQTESRFLDELPSNLIQKIDLKDYRNSFKAKNILANL